MKIIHYICDNMYNEIQWTSSTPFMEKGESKLISVLLKKISKLSSRLLLYRYVNPP